MHSTSTIPRSARSSRVASIASIRQILFATSVALLAACADSATGPDASAPPSGNSSTPSSVVGSWKAGSISSLAFWNSHTGDYIGAASGYAVFFTFQQDGKFTMNVYFMSRNYGCVTESWTEMKGIVQFASSGTFLATPSTGRYKGADNCVARLNFDRAATATEIAGQRSTYYWAFEKNQTDGRTYLMIGPQPDTRSYFSRSE